MNYSPTTYERLMENITTWAQRRRELRAVIVVGSRARTDYPADEWSDLDLILFTTEQASLASSADWLAEIGEVWLAHSSYTGRGDPEWSVLFEGGLKADFVLVTAASSLQQMVDQSPYRFVLQRGVHVLVDKTDPRSPLILPKGGPATHPTPDEFLCAVHGFLVSASRVARELKRAELWPAKALCDCDLKQRLLEMLEWHARATRGPKHDTWHGGRFLAEWADARAVAALPNTFATFSTSDIQRALFATLDLFRRLAVETANRLEYNYPTLTDQRVTEWLHSLLQSQ